MNRDNRLYLSVGTEINQLNPEELQYMAKLVCLMRFCPGFNEELKQIVPDTDGTVSPAQLAAINELMDEWLYDKEWADLLRPKLESVGVRV